MWCTCLLRDFRLRKSCNVSTACSIALQETTSTQILGHFHRRNEGSCQEHAVIFGWGERGKCERYVVY